MEFTCNPISTSDIILFITAIILLVTVFVMKRGNQKNAILNRLQAAENTIYKQLEFHNNLLNKIVIDYKYEDAQPFCGPMIRKGQDAFEVFYSNLTASYNSLDSVSNDGDIDTEENRIKEAFSMLYQKYGNLFGNYYKNLYLLIKYINSREIKDFDKEFYFDLVKSQLSKYEILLLAYDCLWIQDKPPKERFIDLVRDGNILYSLETDNLIESVNSIKHIDIFKERYQIKFKTPIKIND